ncbi:DUF2244 domain-containing protein [Schlegelella sp. S2-27]|uniref:DUF2244 domain-containing protein n=1 Tax=Caldimonas mangrovi TaxID=2944811 RepID=A0ABT0YJ71_9BURK|nr:DUF2244 domain-containing protein [Caldimonas mangrovi]
MEWVLKRNCSISPRQLMAVYASLCVVSFGIASYFWAHGARVVMFFAWVELLGVAAAMLLYARHAGDRERVALQSGRLVVERCDGSRTERVEFDPRRVRVECPDHAEALIVLSARGTSVEIGQHVRPGLRARLAEELRTALRDAAVLRDEGWSAQRR